MDWFLCKDFYSCLNYPFTHALFFFVSKAVDGKTISKAKFTQAKVLVSDPPIFFPTDLPLENVCIPQLVGKNLLMIFDCQHIGC